MKEERLYGYAGKLVRVKLDKKEAKTEKIEPKEIRKFIGGVGYAAKILYDELPRGIDPFDLRNKVVFATGPLTGTGAPGSGFAEVCFKSPLTGAWGESRSGGSGEVL